MWVAVGIVMTGAFVIGFLCGYVCACEEEDTLERYKEKLQMMLDDLDDGIVPHEWGAGLWEAWALLEEEENAVQGG